MSNQKKRKYFNMKESRSHAHARLILRSGPLALSFFCISPPVPLPLPACFLRNPGGHYSSASFSPSRSFKLSDPIWRRRWVRLRVPCQPPPTRGTDAAPTSTADSVPSSVKDSVKDIATSGRAGSSGAGKRRFLLSFCSVFTFRRRYVDKTGGGGRGDFRRKTMIVHARIFCRQIRDRPQNSFFFFFSLFGDSSSAVLTSVTATM